MSDSPLSRGDLASALGSLEKDLDLAEQSRASRLSLTKDEIEQVSETFDDEDRKRVLEFERKTMWKVDLRVLPALTFGYGMLSVVRVNIGAAYPSGMGADLKLDINNRYGIITCVYFITYMLLQLVGNKLLVHYGVRDFITMTVFIWGGITLATGFINTWGALLSLRVLLGIFQAPLFPALLFVFGTWYRRYELQKRFAISYVINNTMIGLSPLACYALTLLHGKGGIAGWRWIFIVEGAFSMALAIVSWFFIPDFPDRNNFLSAEETQLVLQRINDDRGGAAPDPMTWRTFWIHLGDARLWANGVMQMCAFTTNYTLLYFTPVILRGMGWSNAKALLMLTPPIPPTIAVMIVVSYLSDKFQHRSGYICAMTLMVICGLLLTALAKQNAVRYFGIFLTFAGNSTVVPGLLAYASNNVVSHSKRSVMSSLTVCLGGIAGIVTPLVFRHQDYPRYIPGLGVTVGAQVILLIILFFLTVAYMRENRLMRDGKRKTPLEGQPGFYYTL